MGGKKITGGMVVRLLKGAADGKTLKKKKLKKQLKEASGITEKAELKSSLKDALQRSANKVVELFKQWDADGSGVVERSEFVGVVKALGFVDYADDEIVKVFDSFDGNRSGRLSYKEMRAALRAKTRNSVLDHLASVNSSGGTVNSSSRRSQDDAEATSFATIVSLLKELRAQHEEMRTAMAEMKRDIKRDLKRDIGAHWREWVV